MAIKKEYINKSELAKRLDVSPPYISKLVRNGILVFNSKGLIEYQVALQQMEKSKQRVSQKDIAENKDIAQLKADELFWKIQKLKQDYEAEEKLLISIEEVELKTQIIVKTFKDQVENLPNRLCNILAVETDPTVIKKIIEDEISKSLTELADKFEGLADD